MFAARLAIKGVQGHSVACHRCNSNGCTDSPKGAPFLLVHLKTSQHLSISDHLRLSLPSPCNSVVIYVYSRSPHCPIHLQSKDVCAPLCQHDNSVNHIPHTHLPPLRPQKEGIREECLNRSQPWDGRDCERCRTPRGELLRQRWGYRPHWQGGASWISRLPHTHLSSLLRVCPLFFHMNY